MDTDTILSEVSPTPVNKQGPATAAPSVQPEFHHFSFYDQASWDDPAAFAAVKVLLESAVRAAQGGTDGIGVGAGEGSRGPTTLCRSIDNR